MTLDDVRHSYGLFFLAMNSTYTWTHFQQGIIAPILDGITAGKVQFRRTMVTMPFRHSKTDFCVENFIPFYLAHNPSHSVILLSYGKKLARKSGRAIRDKMRSEMYGELFPASALTKTSRASDEFATVSGGKFYASGFDGTVNGLGAHLLVIDDPHKNRGEVLSETIMDQVRAIYTSVVRTRLEPNAAILITTTRWTPSDVVGWRIAEDGAHDYLNDGPYVDSPRAVA